MSDETPAPILIKRRKRAAEAGHHGGAWKVAYADFVTAMMAFFMLMWLLNATTEKQRKGIADYFNPTIAVNRISGGGDGAFGGDSVFTENTLSQNGLGATIRNPTEQKQARGESGVEKTEEADALAAETDGALAALRDELVGAGGESMVSEYLMRHIVTRQTDEGLIVELRDLPGAPLFRGNGAEPAPVLEALMARLAEALDLVRNDVAIGGHVAARPIVELDVEPWRLSAQRADTARRMLVEAGLGAGRVARVTGFADRHPAGRDRLAERNNRLEIVVLRDDV